MKPLVEYIARSLVDEPDQVQVVQREAGRKTVLELSVAEGDTGKVIWSIPLHENMGLVSTYGGRTNYPIIFEDLVILGSVIVSWGDLATPAHRFMAFDKLTGEFVWISSTRLRPPDTIYSAPVLATIGGQRLLIAGASDGWLYALQPRTGKFVWEYRLSRRGLNVCSPFAWRCAACCRRSLRGLLPPPSGEAADCPRGALRAVFLTCLGFAQGVRVPRPRDGVRHQQRNGQCQTQCGQHAAHQRDTLQCGG